MKKLRGAMVLVAALACAAAMPSAAAFSQLANAAALSRMASGGGQTSTSSDAVMVMSTALSFIFI